MSNLAARSSLSSADPVGLRRTLLRCTPSTLPALHAINSKRQGDSSKNSAPRGLPLVSDWHSRDICKAALVCRHPRLLSTRHRARSSRASKVSGLSRAQRVSQVGLLSSALVRTHRTEMYKICMADKKQAVHMFEYREREVDGWRSDGR